MSTPSAPPWPPGDGSGRAPVGSSPACHLLPSLVLPCRAAAACSASSASPHAPSCRPTSCRPRAAASRLWVAAPCLREEWLEALACQGAAAVASRLWAAAPCLPCPVPARPSPRRPRARVAAPCLPCPVPTLGQSLKRKRLLAALPPCHSLAATGRRRPRACGSRHVLLLPPLHRRLGAGPRAAEAQGAAKLLPPPPPAPRRPAPYPSHPRPNSYIQTVCSRPQWSG